jgi:hypothetical protein
VRAEGDFLDRIVDEWDGARKGTAGGQDGNARFYALSLDVAIDIAESRLTRTLTEEECQEYLHMDACPVE